MNSRLPVVLIHGALRSRVGLAPIVWYFRRLGFDARAFGYDTRGGSLEEHGFALERFVSTWLDEGPVPVLGILTHSMGGLVARAYLARQGAAAQSLRQRIVMLGPPNQGAWLAEHLRDVAPFRWLYGRAATELLPERVKTLAPPPHSADVMIIAGGRGNERGYMRAIPGDNDGLVGVAETALPGISPVLVDGAHSVLQWRRDVLRRAADFLRADRQGEQGEH